MSPIKGLQFVDLSVFLPVPKILVIGDLHLGLEENLVSEGIFIPKLHFSELLERLNLLLKKTRPKTIIINGDLKHEFGRITNEEWRNVLQLIDLLSKHSRLVLVKGNHDSILGPIAKKRNVEVKDFFAFNGFYICHGHEIPNDENFKKAKTVIIGHEHPAITIDDSIRRESFKCFLVGMYRRKNLVVVPSFNLLSEGTNILCEKLLSPFLKNIDDFEVFVVGDKIYDFGKVCEHY